ncbi:MAG: hypothetical protein MJZ49_06795 [Bacteroidales bacterium]|nr:hypothetical protein [Bacteroidales bacterium]
MKSNLFKPMSRWLITGIRFMKVLISVFGFLCVGIAFFCTHSLPVMAGEKPTSMCYVAEDTCECEMWVDEANGRWTLYVKNPCDTAVVVECWYLVEYVNGTKDTRTTTIALGAGASTYVDTELLNKARIEEFGSACKPE